MTMKTKTNTHKKPHRTYKNKNKKEQIIFLKNSLKRMRQRTQEIGHRKIT